MPSSSHWKMEMSLAIGTFNTSMLKELIPTQSELLSSILTKISVGVAAALSYIMGNAAVAFWALFKLR